MGSMSIWHWVIVALVVLLLFGKGRISEMMGDLAKGIKSFKKGLADEDMAPGQPAPPPAQVTQSTAQPAAPAQDQAPR
jgi:sec-independent protein translocase protein TatA